PLVDLLFSLARRPEPRVLFMPTATGDHADMIVRFHEALAGRRCLARTLTLFDRKVENVPDFVLGHDVVYVGGGNTASMLGVWRAHGLDVVMREAWAEGIVLSGTSAGAICWFEDGVTDSFGPMLAQLRDGLGMLRGSFCPHYDGEVERRPT